MTLTLVTNLAPASPVTVEYFNQFAETAVQAASLETLAQAFPASGLTAAPSAVSNSTTNTALLTTAAITAPTAGTAWRLKAWGVYSTPGSGPATMSWVAYSGGSAGTALATVAPVTPTVSLTTLAWEAEAEIDFYSATKAQCIGQARLMTATTANTYMFSPTATAGVTITDGSTLTLNFVFGSAVSGSSLQLLGGYAKQMV
jgi:hypothetical protein